VGLEVLAVADQLQSAGQGHCPIIGVREGC
jgi:hypothetical protein